MDEIYYDIIELLLLGLMPIYLVKLTNFAIEGETMGYLLGFLVALCIITTAFHIPEHYRGIALVWILISMSVSYWTIRHPF